MSSFFKKEDKSILLLLAAAALFYSFRENSFGTIAVRLFSLLCCIPIHEFAHARTAFALGDDTAKNQGRVTLNPLSHVGPEGAFLILAFGFGFGKPVPVNTFNFPPEKRKKYYAVTALAGPLSNLLLSILFLFLSFFCLYKFQNIKLYQLLSYASYINISLAVFNLLPIPPLDGSSLLNLILPGNTYAKLYKYRKTLIICVFAAVWILPRLGVNILGTVSSAIFQFFTELICKLF
ncbi:MAG: site-2 protease family protein [Eubacteriales bacterium]|nr:site-2 protease family protein [Eubacteriales bacterium]